MATTAPALLHNMHHFRSSSDVHPHKLHKHKSFSHITFTETGKTEELRDDMSSQSSSNDAKSDLSRKGSVKRTVKKVKKYLSRRFSGHHPHHSQEANYSIMSGGLVGAQFAYAAMGRPASTPNSPSGSRMGNDPFIPLGEDQLHVAPTQNAVDNPDALIDGVHSSQPTGSSEMAIQTPDNSFEFTPDETAHVSDSFDQSFDSVDSRDSVPDPHNETLEINDCLDLSGVDITHPDIPSTPPTQGQEIPVQEEGAGSLNEDHSSGREGQEETTTEPSGYATDDLTIIDSIESLRSLNEAEPPEPNTEAPVKEESPVALEPSELHDSSRSTADSETTDGSETKEPPELAHEVDVPSTDAIDESRSSEPDIQAKEAAFLDKESKPESTQTKPHPPTAYVPYDDELGDMSFDVFNIPYFKATVVALAASGLGVMLANGVYRLFRT